MRKLLLTGISTLALAVATFIPAQADEARSQAGSVSTSAELSGEKEQKNFFSYREVRGTMEIHNQNLNVIAQYLDREVYNLDNAKIGFVEDLLIDPFDKTVTHAIVDVVAMERYIAMPIDQLQSPSGQGVLITALSLAEMSRMPPYQAMGEVWAVADDADETLSTASGPTEIPEDGDINRAELPLRDLVPDDILGREVMTLDGEKAGEVNDVLLDGKSAVTHVVISVGGFLGLGGKNVTVPMQKLSLAEDDSLYVEMTNDELTAMSESDDRAN